MDKQAPVSKIMTPKVIVANLNNQFTQVRDLFTKFSIHHLPVVDGEKVIGIISTHDVIAAYEKVAKKSQALTDDFLNEEIPIEKLMTKNPETVSPEETIQKVVEKFYRTKYSALPVVENGKIKGIVTTNDLTRALKSWFT